MTALLLRASVQIIKSGQPRERYLRLEKSWQTWGASRKPPAAILLHVAQAGCTELFAFHSPYKDLSPGTPLALTDCGNQLSNDRRYLVVNPSSYTPAFVDCVAGGRRWVDRYPTARQRTRRPVCFSRAREKRARAALLRVPRRKRRRPKKCLCA